MPVTSLARIGMMTPLRESLARMADALPPGAAVLLPADWLRAQLEAEVGTEDDGVADMTVREVAEKLGRSVSTVRGWLSAGLIPESYKFGGKQWRVTRAGLSEFLARQRNGKAPAGPGLGMSSSADLASWRKLPARVQGRRETEETTDA